MRVLRFPCPHCRGSGVTEQAASRLTKRQAQYVDFIRAFRDRHGFSPSYQEIAQGVGIRSLAAVHEMVLRLADSGYLAVDKNVNRSIRIPGAEVVEIRRSA